MIYRGSITTDTADTSVMSLHDSVPAHQQPIPESSENVGIPDYEHRASSLEANTTAMVLAQATSPSLPSPQEQLGNMLLSEASLLRASANPGSSGLPETSKSGRPFVERARSIPPSASPSLEDWHFEPEALFSQVYVPVREFDKLNEQRLDLVTTHVRARELRKQLRVQRATVLERQGKLLQDLRVLILTGGKRDLDHLLLQLDETEALNDNLGSAEDSFDQLEADLIEKEWELKSAELRLYRRDTEVLPDLDNPQTPVYRYSHAEAVASGAPSYSAGSAEQSTANLPRKSETDLLRAQIHELEVQHQQLMQEEILRKEVGLFLDDDSSFALRTFPVRHAELVQYLERYEERIEQKQQILNAPVILDTSFDQFPAYQYTGDDLEVLSRQDTPNCVHESVTPWSDEMTLSLQDSPRSRDHLLLPTTLLGDDEPTRAPFAAFANSEDHGLAPGLAYINDWLLYMLRSSSLEILYLRFHLDANNVEEGSQSTKQLILSFWYKDESYIWYIESTERAAESLDPTILSQSKDIDLHPTPSDPNLAKWETQISLKNHSRSKFAHTDEVRDLNAKLKGLIIGG